MLQRESEPVAAPDFLTGGGEMGALMRAKDWSSTPLGPFCQWPQSLRTTVSLLLNTRFPMFLFWGKEAICLYNDAYRPSLGAHKHPQALGQRGEECWHEIWHIIGPQIDAVMSRAEPTFYEDQLVPFDRNGYFEEIYFTYSYSPVRDESGVGGTLVVCSETTGRVIHERRLRCLGQLALRATDVTRAGEPPSAATACERTVAALSHNDRDAAFVLLYLRDPDRPGTARLMAQAGILPGHPAAPPRVELGDAAPAAPWPVGEVARTQRPAVVTDLDRRYTGALRLPSGAWPEPLRTAVVMPVPRSGSTEVSGVLVMGVSPRRALDHEYLTFMHLCAGHVAAAVDSAAVFEAERQRRLAAETLREREALLRLAMKSSRMGAWVRDPSSDTVWWSPELEALFGLPPGRFGGTRAGFHDLVHPDDAEAARREVDRAVQERRDYTIEFRFLHADGSVRWMEGRGQAVYGPDGAPERLYGIGIDITQRKQVEERLREADRRKDEFLAILAHELRNPLAPIISSLELWQRRSHDPDTAARARSIIGRHVRQLVRLVDDLLHISRITQGKVALVREAVDLRLVAQGAVETSQPLIDEGTHRLEVHLPPEPLWVEGDPVRLSQVVANLLNNAARYTPPGGQIRLLLSRERGEAVLMVQDNGIGIPQEMLGEIFGLFRQVDRRIERDKGGLGIGLTLVHSLVELHGGSVVARSLGLGHGSEFTVRLPLQAGVAAPQFAVTAAPSDPAAAPQPTGRRVLVVDDNVDAADSLGELVSELGHTAAVSYDGEAALQRAREFRPDVVLLDIGMPRMNGYEVARRLRAEPALARRPVLVALTGWGQDSDRQRSQEAGFDHHLVKPPDLEKLESLLKSA